MLFTPQPGEFLFKRYSEALWHGNRNENKIFLTFDDGPTPGVTDKLLNVLSKKKIKAHFFCIGNNVLKEKNLFNEIVSEHHITGNHTCSHVNLFRTSWKKYEEDILKCNEIFKSDFFRPPYGRITRSAIRKISEIGLRTVLWDIITYDFLQTHNADHCLKIIRKRLRPGSIIVFHDSKKAQKNMFRALEFLITYAECKSLEFSLLK